MYDVQDSVYNQTKGRPVLRDCLKRGEKTENFPWVNKIRKHNKLVRKILPLIRTSGMMPMRNAAFGLMHYQLLDQRCKRAD